MKRLHDHCRPLWVGIVAAALSLVSFGCESEVRRAIFSLEEQTWQYAGATGRQMMTDHYHIYTTMRDEVFVDVLPGFMESAFEAYTQLLPAPRSADSPADIYLFETRYQWEKFTLETYPEQAYTYLHIQYGGYTDQPSATAVVLNIRRDRTLAVLAHEALHQYLAQYFPVPVPAWLNEGLACQWEAFTLDGDVPIFTPRHNYLRTNALREALTKQDGLFELTDLLRMHAGDLFRPGSKSPTAYYAQAWSLVLFLRFGAEGTYAGRFAELLADAGTDRQRVAGSAYRIASAVPNAENLSAGEVIFRHYITDDLAAFADEYTVFVKQLAYPKSKWAGL